MSAMKGRAWKFGDNVLNDGGITTLELTRLGVFDPTELGRSCMAGIDPEFPKKAKPGDFIVAGKQFGKGQLHVQGPLGVKGLGVGLITESMTRNFFRLAVSAGVQMLPFVPGASTEIGEGDALDVDFRTGEIRNLTRGTSLRAAPLPDFLWEFIDAGGEKEWLGRKYGT
jgi:3-isopropylmalate/(R)-2-methylmalate dehydratase small subunit